MDVAELKAFRDRAGLKQADMAELIGLSLRAYQDIEGRVSGLRRLHELALERASLGLALKHRDIGLALPSVRKDALDLAGLIRGD